MTYRETPVMAPTHNYTVDDIPYAEFFPNSLEASIADSSSAGSDASRLSISR